MIKYIEKYLAEDARMCSDLNIARKKFSTTEVVNHLKSLMKVYLDYNEILKTRKHNNTKMDTAYPTYYNRKYHFQTDGYASEYSASLYDHLVDLLFAGMAGPMRRTILEELRDFYLKDVLEIGCGTGSATEIVASFLHNSEIIAIDLSHEYISFTKKGRALKDVEYKQMNGIRINGEFDLIFHVFLLHELPSTEREKLLTEQLKALKPGGKGIIVESLQMGDISFKDEVLYDFPK